MPGASSCVKAIALLTVVWLVGALTTIAALSTDGTSSTQRAPWLVNDATSGNEDTTSEDSSDVTGLFSDMDTDFMTTESPATTLAIGIINSEDNPEEADWSYIMNLWEDANISFTGVNMSMHSEDDIFSYREVVKDLRSVKPKAVIGPYAWPFAVATEHMRIPYFVTSQVPSDQPVTPYLIKLFPDAHVFARATEDMLRYYNIKKVALFHDSDAGRIILERLAQQSWMEVTGFFINKKSILEVREQLKTARSNYYTSFISILNTTNTNYLLDQGLSLSMFSPPHKWLLVNLGLREYTLESYVDSHANITVLRLMMDYNSKACALGTDYISLRRAAFHDAVRLYLHLYQTHVLRTQERVSFRRTVRQLQMDGCTGRLVFSRFGERTESFLQLMTLEGYKSGASGTWRSGPQDFNKRVEPSKTYSTVSQLSGNVFGDDPMRITVILEPPFVQRRTEKTYEYDSGHPEFEGFIIDILMEMVKLLDFKFNISEVPDGKFGSLKPPPRGWTGMVRQLVDDKADIALAPFQMSTERAQVVDFTKPFMTKGTTVVVKRPEQKIWMFQFLSPLSNIVWSAIFVAFVGTSLMLFAVSRVNSDRQAKYTHNLRESFWYIWGTLLRGSLSGSPHAISSRIVSSAWWFFCLILSSIYTANLAAFLTITIGDVGINTAQDLALQELFDYGTVEGSQTETFFKHTRMTYYSRMWAHMSVLSPKSISRTTDIGFERVRKGKYAFIWDSPTIRYTISNDCDLMEIGSPFDLKGYGFAYQKNAPYGDKLSWALLKLQDEGILYRLERKWWRPQFCPNHQQSAKTKSLDLETVAGMYVVILCGAVISTLLCLMQYCYSQMRRKRKARRAKEKATSESGNAQALDPEFRRENSQSKTYDDQEEAREANQDEITYANHSPLHFRSASEWSYQ